MKHRDLDLLFKVTEVMEVQTLTSDKSAILNPIDLKMVLVPGDNKMNK